jgi:hypothetical protein
MWHPDSLAPFTAQTLNSLTIASRYTGKPVNMSELIDMVFKEADCAKICYAPKDQTGKGKTRSQTDEALTITDGNNRKCHKGKCHHCQKEGHWAYKCFTKKWEEKAAKAQSSQAIQVSTSTSTSSKPENKPVGSANAITIDNSDDDSFWLIEEVETYMHTTYTALNPKMSDSDMESDIDDEASCAKLAGVEDKQALDWFGSDNQLVTEGKDSDTREEANMATLKEEDAPYSEAQPIPHHALHVPIISHTPASLEEWIKRAMPSESSSYMRTTLLRGRTGHS